MNATLSNLAAGLLSATEEGEAASNPIIPEWNEVIWGSVGILHPAHCHVETGPAADQEGHGSAYRAHPGRPRRRRKRPL